MGKQYRDYKKLVWKIKNKEMKNLHPAPHISNLTQWNQ